MRIKVGGIWHEAEPGKAVMVEFTDDDKRNIARMAPEATKYAVFTDDDGRTREQKLEWME